MSSILTFSNKSVKVFTLKNRFLITAEVLHSIRMCLTVQIRIEFFEIFLLTVNIF